MKKIYCFLLMFIINIDVSYAENLIVIDPSSDRITINSGFDGDELIVYGTKKDGDLAIIVRGADSNMLVRKKSEIMGMWVNTQSVIFDKVPLYYDYAIVGEEENLAGNLTLKDLGIGINSMNYNNDEEDKLKADIFHESLIRIRQTEGLLPLSTKKVEFITPEFFKVKFALPSNVPVGKYIIEAFLFKDGKVIDSYRSDFPVLQIGFNGNINNWASNHSWFYGLGMVIFAVFMGWASNFVSRKK